jgi:hypothetical protein
VNRLPLLTSVSLLATTLFCGGLAAQPTTVPTLTSGQPTQGTIGSEDPRLASDNSSYEVYRIRVNAGQRVTATLTSTAFVPVLSVGSSVAGTCDGCSSNSADKGGTATASKAAVSAGFMEIRVNTMEAGEAGAFTLTATVADPVRLTPAPLTLDQSVRGALATTDATNDDGAFMDAFNVTLRVGRPIQIDLTSTEFDPKVSLWGPGDGGAMVQLADDDDSGPGNNARIRFTATRAGAYQIRAMALSEGNTGAYTLRAGAPPARVPLPAPTPLALGVEASGTLAENGPMAEEGGEEMLVQRYAFEAVAGKSYRVKAQSGAFDTYVAVGRIKPDGSFEELVGDDDGAGEGTNSRLRWRAETSGRYIVQVRALGSGMGAFTTTIEERPADAPAPTPTAIGIGATLSGALTDGGPRSSSDDKLYGLYAVSLKRGERVTVRMTKADGADFDPYLEVGTGSATDFTKIAEDDDGGGELNARLRFVAPADGTYLIRTTATTNTAEGAFTVSVAPTPPAVTPPAPTPLALGTAVNGTLDQTDPSMNDDKLYERFVFEGEIGATYVITLNSSAFDTIVGVRPQSRVDDDYKTDDDGAGEGTNSKLEYTVEHGGPQIVRVTGLSETSEGAFTVQVVKK